MYGRDNEGMKIGCKLGLPMGVCRKNKINTVKIV